MNGGGSGNDRDSFVLSVLRSELLQSCHSLFLATHTTIVRLLSLNGHVHCQLFAAAASIAIAVGNDGFTIHCSECLSSRLLMLIVSKQRISLFTCIHLVVFARLYWTAIVRLLQNSSSGSSLLSAIVIATTAGNERNCNHKSNVLMSAS